MACLRFTDLQSRPMEFLDLTSLTLDELQHLVQLGKKKLLFRRQPGYSRMTPCLQLSCH
jgi:hypothetical protein